MKYRTCSLCQNHGVPTGYRHCRECELREVAKEGMRTFREDMKAMAAEGTGDETAAG